MHQCRFEWIDIKDHLPMKCPRIVHDSLEYCCIHDPKGFTGCRYNYRNINMKKGTLEENEMFPALCMVTHQFAKAQKILKKYQINTK